MSRKEYSRKAAILSLKKVLLARREALRKALDGDMTMLHKLEKEAGDMVDDATASVEDAVNTQLVEATSLQLAQAEKALERMRKGRFGICQRCEGVIPLARLNALPSTVFCVSCKSELEKHGNANADDASDWSRMDSGESSSELEGVGTIH